MEYITSKSNPKIALAKKLQVKKYRDAERLFIFEGIKLFCEAKDNKVELEYIFASESGYSEYKSDLCAYDDILYVIPDPLYRGISCENAPQGILCVAKYIDKSHFFNTIIYENLQNGKFERIFLLENIQDPGNLGTIIRCAAAFGYDKIVLSKGCADIYHQRTIRASMGAVFKTNISVCGDMCAYIKSLKEAKYRVICAALSDDAEKLGSFEIEKNTVFVVGNEGSGITKEVMASSDGCVIIEMSNMESLNASVAASILMWETSKMKK